jgi:large subunit ribosomal protein L28
MSLLDSVGSVSFCKGVRVVASVCELCGKHPGFGMNVSHSHRRTKRRWNPNIQNVRALIGGATKRINVCTSCIRAGKVTKPPIRNASLYLNK